MKENCNTLIKENKNLILNFEKNFEKKIEYYNIENKKQISDYKEDLVYQFVNSIYSLLYRQINETLNFLLIKDCTYIEIPILIDQVQNLYYLYFEYLDNSKYKSDYWKLLENSILENVEFDYTYVEPDNFTSHYVSAIIKKIKNDNQTIPIPKRKKSNTGGKSNKTWFEVGFEFANGNIYELIAKKYSHEKIAETRFTTGRIEIDTYRLWISCSLGNSKEDNKYKSIFQRPNAEKELNIVIEYCRSNNIEISEKFLTRMNEFNIHISN